MCYIDIEATAERAGYLTGRVPYNSWDWWSLRTKPTRFERIGRWLLKNAWVFGAVLVGLILYHFIVAEHDTDDVGRADSLRKLPQWQSDV